MTATRIDKLLGADPGQPLGKIVQHAQSMGELATRLQAVLEAAGRDHLRAANVREDGTLVLLCSSPSWAARLRFESERLIAAATEAGFSVARVKVRVGHSA